MLQQQEQENRLIAAICAAPTALKIHGIAKGKKITSYPAMKDELTDYYKYLEDKVVIDGICQFIELYLKNILFMRSFIYKYYVLFSNIYFLLNI